MTELEMCCGTTCDKQRVAAEFEKLKRERDEFERAYRNLFNKRSLRVHDLQKSVWREMDKRCFPGAYMQIVCDKILEYGCAEVADLKKQIERINRDRDEALALAEHFKQCAIYSQEEDWLSSFERVIDDDGNTLFDNEKAQILWDGARVTVSNGPLTPPKSKIKCKICEGTGIANMRYGGVDECECKRAQETGDE